MISYLTPLDLCENPFIELVKQKTYYLLEMLILLLIKPKFKTEQTNW